MFLATNVGRDELMSLGTCLGKFTKSEKFRLEVTALQMIAPLAQNKVWVKANAEMAFLYGNHIAKAGLARMTDEVQQYDGVVVFNASDVPLGFGVAAHATLACQTLEPTAHAILHQADVGEYLRRESELS
jgi:60S ribosome subunit biogenesis protein NIP7